MPSPVEPSTTLPAIAERPIGGETIQTVNARDLHASLKVGRDFSSWIKDRVTKYRFVEGQDFVSYEDLSSPNPGSSKSRAQTVKEYAVSLDMAKELAMVENNEAGRECRRHFIECERRLKEGQVAPLDLRDHKQLAAAALQLVQINQELTAERDDALKLVADAKPKLKAFDEFVAADGSFLMSSVAAQFGIKQTSFFKALQDKDILFRKEGRLFPRTQYRGRGFFVIRPEIHKGRTFHSVRLTSKGVVWLAGVLGIAQPDLFHPSNLEIAS